MNFSICLASRERSTLLMHLLESIKNTTMDIENVEIIIGIDDDDAESADCKVHACNKYSFVKFFSQPRSKYLNRDYINRGYKEFSSRGKFAIALNDDVIFKTQNWDKIANEKMENYLSDKPDRIAYGYFSDGILNRFNMGFSCFPLLTKEAIEAMGFMMVEERRAWTADIDTWRIYSAVERVCNIGEVNLHHDSYHSGTRSRDKTSYHVESISNESQENPPVGNYIKKLSDIIKRGK